MKHHLMHTVSRKKRWTFLYFALLFDSKSARINRTDSVLGATKYITSISGKFCRFIESFSTRDMFCSMISYIVRMDEITRVDSSSMTNTIQPLDFPRGATIEQRWEVNGWIMEIKWKKGEMIFKTWRCKVTKIKKLVTFIPLASPITSSKNFFWITSFRHLIQDQDSSRKRKEQNAIPEIRKLLATYLCSLISLFENSFHPQARRGVFQQWYLTQHLFFVMKVTSAIIPIEQLNISAFISTCPALGLHAAARTCYMHYICIYSICVCVYPTIISFLSIFRSSSND